MLIASLITCQPSTPYPPHLSKQKFGNNPSKNHDPHSINTLSHLTSAEHQSIRPPSLPHPIPSFTSHPCSPHPPHPRNLPTSQPSQLGFNSRSSRTHLATPHGRTSTAPSSEDRDLSDPPSAFQMAKSKRRRCRHGAEASRGRAGKCKSQRMPSTGGRVQ